MIHCPVCSVPNHHLAVTCSSCGSFVQRRVDNLDLFSVLWKVIEQPSKAFLEIAIARHKNFALFLSGVAGFAISFGMLWAMHAGDYTDSLLNIMAAGLVAGPFCGMFSLLFLSAVHTSIAHLTGVHVKYRNSFAVIGYALMPVAVISLTAVPIELLSFGIFFFSSNPSPYLLKPASFLLLMGLDGVLVLWCGILMLIGTKELFGSGWLRAAVVVGVTLLLYAGILAGAVLKLTGGKF